MTALAEDTLSKILKAVSPDDDLTLYISSQAPQLITALGRGYVQRGQLVVDFIQMESLIAPVSPYLESTTLEWIQSLSLYLVQSTDIGSLAHCLTSALAESALIAASFFPYLLHLALITQRSATTPFHTEIAAIFQSFFEDKDAKNHAGCRILLEATMFLRSQSRPDESSPADREAWFEISHLDAANAALRCSLPKTALLLVEIYDSRRRGPNRRSMQEPNLDVEGLLHAIYDQLDDLDSFYGVSDESSLKAVMQRAEHENDGLKLLSLQGAEYDYAVTDRQDFTKPIKGILGALERLNLAGLSNSLIENSSSHGVPKDFADVYYSAARKLEKWDIASPSETKSEAATTFALMQTLSSSRSHSEIQKALSKALLQNPERISAANSSAALLRSSMRTLAVAAEASEVLLNTSTAHLGEILVSMKQKTHWMRIGRYDDVEAILSARTTLLSIAKTILPTPDTDVTLRRQLALAHVDSLLKISEISIDQGKLQHALTACTRISALVGTLKGSGIHIEGASVSDEASVLWAQGESLASINALKRLHRSVDYEKQDIEVTPAKTLARLASQIADARLEKPETIIEMYFKPAVRACEQHHLDSTSGFVYHRFALFCDSQLQNADNNEDFERVKYLVDQKKTEIAHMIQLPQESDPEERKIHQHELSKARKWLEIDMTEYRRLQSNKETLLQQCLQNYLLSLQTSEDYNGDILRFCSLWLSHSDQAIANGAVRLHLMKVPTRKFGDMMGQITSRLLDQQDDFQGLLHSLVFQVSKDHPYHGSYQLFSMRHGMQTEHDEPAMSRRRAAEKIGNQLQNTPGRTRELWLSISTINICYYRLAIEARSKSGKYESGQRIPISRSDEATNLGVKFRKNLCPPPTMNISLREDRNYEAVPTVARLRSEMSIAGGVSKPKVITCLASDGRDYKQLVKGGNDDPRQDAIMEQVFENVSKLLQQNRDTRQRDLKINTYRIVPLTTSSGAIIEWVQDTIPLTEYLTPSHRTHFPRDWKPEQCRRLIQEAQSKSTEQRVRAYRTVCSNFHPCLHYFFLENFDGPDEWFDKRLAYSRSTAAISILGHVMGLGDRHLGNILLHQKTGEVVHIDLGIAFEAGRVLPVPELVPFRLTRDIVDGLGITKVEGVFRRCCEFTLQALRRESATIETILDVLRFDPLYSWTTSPVRLKKMQQAQLASLRPESDRAPLGADQEGGEAERAITVVKKKLSKTLSVQATVNELIQQAQDERNLAVLYAGWSAYM